ncbi:MAG TPA: hypothetical protein VG389_12810 [Myxococcota bacterium]|jgi:hypothetical protein|nr:hypothetical protein [Myxococcota bacterium]
MPWLIRDEIFRARDGKDFDLRTMTEADACFLRWLDARAAAGESYPALLPSVTGPGGYLLNNAERPDPRVRTRPVFRAAMDLLARVAERDGLKLPKAVVDGTRGGVHSVTDAARELGITRAAVVRAIQEGRLAAYRMG